MQRVPIGALNYFEQLGLQQFLDAPGVAGHGDGQPAIAPPGGVNKWIAVSGSAPLNQFHNVSWNERPFRLTLKDAVFVYASATDNRTNDRSIPFARRE